jgi:hypothetical protein
VYRFNSSSDSSLYNNYYVLEPCLLDLTTCILDFSVALKTTAFRKNRTTDLRMCRYLNGVAQDWITVTSTWATGSGERSSLQYRTSNTC